MDMWNLPGGGMEYGEGTWETVVREVKEETWLDVEVERLIGMYKKPATPDDLVFLFLCTPVWGELTLSDESDELWYFALDDFPINTNPKHVSRVKDYFKDPDKLHMRENLEPWSRDFLTSLWINS